MTVSQWLERSLGEVMVVARELRALTPRLAAEPRALASYGKLQSRFEQLDGWVLEKDLTEARRRLGILHLDDAAPVAELSGGEQARVLLAGCLLARPTVLLLDEPTNHLDADGLTWLETFLADFRGAVLVVSHDRRFLDLAVTQIIELDGVHREMQRYVGGFSGFREERARRWARLLSDFEAQEKLRRRLEADIIRTHEQSQRSERAAAALGAGTPHAKRVAKKVAKKALSRRRRLERMMNAASWIAEPEQADRFKLTFAAHSERGRRVLSLQGARLERGGECVLSDATVIVRGGDRVAITGPNGSGKSTLVDALTGALPLARGARETSVTIGALPQSHDHLPLDEALLTFVRRQVVMDEDEIRTLLGHFLFEADRMGQPLRTLSAGERSRLLLVVLVASRAQLLVLDEPTNHLDFDALDVVEAALRAFQGTLVVVSHDRAFLEAIRCTRLLVVAGGRVAETAGA